MTQYERMKQGLLYDPFDREIQDKQRVYQDLLFGFNRLSSAEISKKNEYMKKVFASCGDNCYIELPLYANWGGHHVHFGSNVYANFNLTLVDDGHIYVGDNVMFGPNVTVATANHPLDSYLRSRGLQYNRDVYIGDNTWIGSGVMIVPGVKIGNDCVIGAGSIVTGDIPDMTLAAGNPCRVLRKIDERDKEFYYKNDRIDWENVSDFLKM